MLFRRAMNQRAVISMKPFCGRAMLCAVADCNKQEIGIAYTLHPPSVHSEPSCEIANSRTWLLFNGVGKFLPYTYLVEQKGNYVYLTDLIGKYKC